VYAATPPLLSPQFPDVVDFGQRAADCALEIRCSDSPLLVVSFGLNPGFVAAVGLLKTLSVKRRECDFLSAHCPAVARVHRGQCLPGPSDQIGCCQLRPDLSIARGCADVSVYTLMKLLGHESMTTSQRYVTAAGTETRSAAARNGLYALIPGCANDADLEIWLDRDS
jgi:hypothetical protein